MILASRWIRSSYVPETNGLIAYKDGKPVLTEMDVPPEKLESYIGKDVAKKLLETEQTKDYGDIESTLPRLPAHVLEGEDCQVGGEWANRFYDQTVPQFLGKYGKQWGARVGEGDVRAAGMKYDHDLRITEDPDGDHYRQDRGKSLILAINRTSYEKPYRSWQTGRNEVTATDWRLQLHILPFTPEMLAGVKQPQPMFKPKETGDEKEAGERQTDIRRGTKAGNAYHPENDPEAGRQLRDIKSLIARTDSPETWEHWKDIKDATDKPADAGVIDKLAAKHGLPVVWVKDANFAGVILDTKDGRVILLDEEATDVPYLSIARHEIFHHLVKNFDQDAYNLIGLVDTESPAFQRYAKSYREAMGATTASLDDFQVAEELSADWYSGVKEISGITLKDAFGKNKGKAFKTREQMMTRPSYKPRKMPPADEDEPPERTTGIKNAVTEAEREAKGMGPVEVPLRMRRGFEEVLAKGKKIVDSGTIDPRFLAEQLTIKPRALSPEETAVLDL